MYVDGPVVDPLNTQLGVRVSGAVHVSPAGPRGGIGAVPARKEGQRTAVGRPVAAYRTREKGAAQGGAPTPFALGFDLLGVVVSNPTVTCTKSEQHPWWCSPQFCVLGDAPGDDSFHVSQPSVLTTADAEVELHVTQLGDEIHLELTITSRTRTELCDCGQRPAMSVTCLLTPHEFDLLESCAWGMLTRVARPLGGAA